MLPCDAIPVFKALLIKIQWSWKLREIKENDNILISEAIWSYVVHKYI